jgi:putative NADH-flavin reductase
MRIAIFGGGGRLGQAIMNQNQHHDLTAVVRNPLKTRYVH